MGRSSVKVDQGGAGAAASRGDVCHSILIYSNQNLDHTGRSQLSSENRNAIHRVSNMH